jgi:diaminohydroxyphosphoribosylaminopyrimidine deaminase / 5-amino-6-(5-phosphoribosylamino)uracil reductase
MINDELWMQRALQLAGYGLGTVSPNPMVGCVIVHCDKVIGEGWHRHFGGPHAEVWAVEDTEKRNNGHLLSESTVYVTLEPCSHTGKTPPCADLLVKKNVRRVVICNSDPNPLVSGRGIKRLREAGIEVGCDVLANQGPELNKRFFTSINKKRPFIILKWAETADGFLSGKNGETVRISGAKSNVRVHKWRSEEDAILVGYNTAVNDNPRLNVRNWKGNDPVRVILDRHLQLPGSLHLFDQSQPTVIVNYNEESEQPDYPERYSAEKKIAYLRLESGVNEIEQLLQQLVQRGIQSVLVEGGAAILQAFIDSGLWDEIRRCQGPGILGAGIAAPTFRAALIHSEKVGGDLWSFYSPKNK